MSKQAYYAARAIDERLQAQAAADPRAAAVHLEMSARYEALASDPSIELPRAVLTSDDAPTHAQRGSDRRFIASPTD